MGITEKRRQTNHFFSMDMAMSAMTEQCFLPVEDRNICCMLHLPASARPPFVITCHGLFSSKESEKFLSIAEIFTRQGIAVIRFDFGGCGESTGDFAATTVTRRLTELEAVAAFYRRHEKLGSAFGIMGSSLGGYLAVLCASRRHVSALSIWAAPYDLLALADNVPPGDLQRLRQDFFDDARQYSLASVLGGVHTIQIIQGKRDDIVPWKHGEEIYSRAGEPKEIELLAEADHSITRKECRQRAFEKSLSWFSRHIL